MNDTGFEMDVATTALYRTALGWFLADLAATLGTLCWSLDDLRLLAEKL
jgi:hypothetical protein